MTGDKKAELNVVGMACAGCSVAVEKSLRSLEGVSSAKVDLAKKVAFVEFNPDKQTLDGMKKAIEKAGYKVAGSRIL
jgi:copper chaperone CopZ